MQIYTTDTHFVFVFGYNAELIELVKALPERRFCSPKFKTIPTDKYWSVPLEYDATVRAFAKAYRFEFVGDVPEPKKALPPPKTDLIPYTLPDLSKPFGLRKIVPFEHQKSGVRWLAEKRKAILADDMGLGKLQPIDSKILTPYGWTKIGLCRVGDSVIGSNGQTTQISGVYPQGINDVWRVTFSDGSSVEAGDEHLWTMRYWKGGRKLSDIVVTTREMRLGLIHGGVDLSKTTLYLPMLTSPVQFSDMYSFAIRPYTLGALIANGYLDAATPMLSVNSLDGDEIETMLSADFIKFSRFNYGSVERFSILGCGKHLRALNLNVLSRDKFIPRHYLQSSANDRIHLLHGLMDCDGSISKTNSRLTYSTISKQLAIDFVELVEGLGGIASIKTYDRTKENKPIEYSVRLRLPSSIEPFTVSRKLNRYHPQRLALPCRTFVSATYSRTVETVCIAVTAPDQLYVTEHCILTHNTMQALLAAASYNLPIIVVCPASLQDNWKREAAAVDVRLHSVFSWAKFPDSIVGDYVIIFDESHFAQAGTGSIRGKKFLHLSKYARAVFCLTGTPMKNGRPINLLPLLIATDHPIAKDVRHFHIRYCDAKKTPWCHWDTTGARNLDELHAKTKDTILRRMKKDCLDLPAKTRVVRDADVSAAARAAYNEKFSELQATYQDRIRKGLIGTGGEELVLMNHLRHAASIAKVDSAIILAQEALEEQGAVVVFTAFEASARAISERLKGCLLTGSTPVHTRQGLVDEFQSKGGAFVSTIRAGGVGITLTKASTVIMSDREWTPGDVMQAEDRLHRIGQKGNVLSVWLQYDDSDKAVDAILERKEERIDLVLSGKRKTMQGTGSVNSIAKEMARQILG